VRADVLVEDDVKAFIDRVIAAYGRLDVAFNNAGITLEKLLHDYSVAEWDLVLNTKLRGVFLAIKYEVPHMIASGGGTIVVTSSSNAIATTERRSAYTASKRALVGLVQSVALDYAEKGIRVNALISGTTDTPLVRRAAGGGRSCGRLEDPRQPVGKVACARGPSHGDSGGDRRLCADAGFRRASLPHWRRPGDRRRQDGACGMIRCYPRGFLMRHRRREKSNACSEWNASGLVARSRLISSTPFFLRRTHKYCEDPTGASGSAFGWGLGPRPSSSWILCPREPMRHPPGASSAE
jgi:hypothetical protein